MDIDDYQADAIQCLAIKQKGADAIAHRGLGLTGTAGILANQLKKMVSTQMGTSRS